MTTVWLHTHLPRLRSGETPDVISVKVPGQHVAYASWVSVKDVEFRVFQPGRKRCVDQGVRNVHAWVVGTEILRVGASWDYSRSERPKCYRQALYDPFKGRTFVDSETLEPVVSARLAVVSGKNVFYVPEG